MVQTLFSLCLQISGVLPLAVCFDAMVENLITILVHIWTDKIKATDDKQIFLEIKFYLSRDIKRFVLLDDIALFLLKPSIQFFGGKSSHGHSYSDYHQIHLDNTRWSYLIYFNVRNMLKIRQNKNPLKHCIFRCRMLKMVFP